MTSETVVNCLVNYTARFGIPEEVLTDNGVNFVFKVTKMFYETLGIHQICTFPYHHRQMERWNGSMPH